MTLTLYHSHCTPPRPTHAALSLFCCQSTGPLRLNESSLTRCGARRVCSLTSGGSAGDLTVSIKGDKEGNTLTIEGARVLPHPKTQKPRMNVVAYPNPRLAASDCSNDWDKQSPHRFESVFSRAHHPCPLFRK